MSYPGDLLSDIALLKTLADASDEISLDRFHAQDLVIETKPDATPVTDADRTVENKIRSILANERPNDLIVGEDRVLARLHFVARQFVKRAKRDVDRTHDVKPILGMEKPKTTWLKRRDLACGFLDPKAYLVGKCRRLRRARKLNSCGLRFGMKRREGLNQGFHA